MFTMKEVCDRFGMPYETLRYYCNEGLVPNVKRDKNNYRVFDERDISWLKSLQCLKRCGMSLKDMKHYMRLCLQGPSSIDERKKLLADQKLAILRKIDELSESIDFIDDKQVFYDKVLAGELPYVSNLINAEI